uniref:Fucosyltransferase n=1 Tax=Parascaris univalens TaxID=6257 RepID=A0A915C4Y5_PARUN
MFFEWAKEYQYTSISNDYKFCELCEKLHVDNITKTYADIQEWWQGNSSNTRCITIASPWNLKHIREIVCILILVIVALHLTLRYKSYANFVRRTKRYLTRAVSEMII